MRGVRHARRAAAETRGRDAGAQPVRVPGLYGEVRVGDAGAGGRRSAGECDASGARDQRAVVSALRQPRASERGRGHAVALHVLRGRMEGDSMKAGRPRPPTGPRPKPKPKPAPMPMSLYEVCTRLEAIQAVLGDIRDVLRA